MLVYAIFYAKPRYESVIVKALDIFADKFFHVKFS